MTSDRVKEEMDAAASIAAQALSVRMNEDPKLDRRTVLVLGQWIRDHYMEAGYKRLAKIIAQMKEQ
jgi:hypothetical protein